MELTAMQNSANALATSCEPSETALNATVHAPDGEAISLSDKLRSKISSKPEHWAAARQFVRASQQ
jgi:hypothetical protein